MAVHATGQSDRAEMHLHNSRSEIDRAEAALMLALDRHAYGEASRFAVRLALEEALVNAFHHGHKHLPADATVTFAFSVGKDELTISVTDQGPGFDPATIPDCTLEENLEKSSGRGLMLMKSFMTAVHHELGGRRLMLTYRRPEE